MRRYALHAFVVLAIVATLVGCRADILDSGARVRPGPEADPGQEIFLITRKGIVYVPINRWEEYTNPPPERVDIQAAMEHEFVHARRQRRETWFEANFTRRSARARWHEERIAYEAEMRYHLDHGLNPLEGVFVRKMTNSWYGGMIDEAGARAWFRETLERLEQEDRPWLQ